MSRFGLQFYLVMFVIVGAGTFARAQSPAEALARLTALLPASGDAFADAALPDIASAARRLEDACARSADMYELAPAEVLRRSSTLVGIKRQLDELVENNFKLRTSIVNVTPDSRQHAAAHKYLQVLGALIDVAGRLRYLLVDALDEAAGELATHQQQREELVDLLIAARSSSGAAVLAPLLADPPRGAAVPIPSPRLRAKVLELIAATAQVDLLPQVATYLQKSDTPAANVLLAADVVRRVGLPQEIRPGQDPALPRPAITARELREVLTRLRIPRRQRQLQDQRTELLAWADRHARFGITDGEYRLGNAVIKPGDWLLMRNPSPYNLFTDLSPGLFTHVGVVSLERSTDGISRMVIVDLPDRGRMPATNADTFVKRTRHYVFVRHRDPVKAAEMGEVAASMIGNETQFDLCFRTDRVLKLERQSLAGKKIHTYCAGLLLLCAMQTGLPRNELFPIPERAAGGRTSENLAKLGMSIGDDFVSPSGALFSRALEIVGRREPLYEPTREIEEAVYDYFATSIMHRNMTPSSDLYQSLRLKLAEASRTNPLLAHALASAVGVPADTDLVAGAKATAVIEALDEVAYGASRQFMAASRALRAGSPSELRRNRVAEDKIAEFQQYQQRHADLFRRWQSGEISPRALRIELVQHYISLGKRNLDARFFQAGS